MITVITWQCAGGILFISAAVDKKDIHNESRKKVNVQIEDLYAYLFILLYSSHAKSN